MPHDIFVPTDEAARSASGLASSPDFLQGLATDPRTTLGALGLTIDDATAAAIRAQARTPVRSSTYQAAIVHIDT